MDRRELREKRRRMMEEDDSGASSEVARAGPAKRSKPTASSSSSLRTPTRSMPSQEDSGSPSTRVKLHFGGRVYRAGDDSSPAAKTLRGVAPDQLLGQPDEFTVDAAYAAADQAALSKSNMVPSLLASPSIHEAPASSSSPTSTKPGASSQPLAQDSDSDLEIGPSSSPFVSPFSSPARARKVPFKSPEKQPQQPGQDSSDVELPVNYQNLLSLHTALERAIMLHISTEGKAGLIASAVAHASQQPNVASTYKVEIPALAPYTALKGVVERGSGLQFGEKQLGQLLWIWQRASDARLKRGDQTARGLGFILSRVPDVSKGFGSKSGTWGVGIELEVKRNEPEPTMELLGASASPRKQAGRSSLGGGGGGARDGMSVVALWSQGSDGRKELVRQTLGQMVLDQLEDTSPSASARSLGVPNITPVKRTAAAAGGTAMPPTPPPTQRKSKTVNIHPDVSAMDIAAFAEVPSATLPSLSLGTPTKHRQVDYDMLAAGIEGLSSPTKASSSSSSGSSHKPTAKERANSLAERIRQKEQNQKAAAATQPKLDIISPTRKSLKSNTPAADRERQRMAALKHKSMLSRLPDVADAVFMLFASKAVPPSPSAMASGKGRRAMPLDEVCSVVVKSSKIALSVSEASESVKLLCQLCPAFVQCSAMDPASPNKQLWVQAQCGDAGVRLREAKGVIRKELVTST